MVVLGGGAYPLTSLRCVRGSDSGGGLAGQRGSVPWGRGEDSSLWASGTVHYAAPRSGLGAVAVTTGVAMSVEAWPGREGGGLSADAVEGARALVRAPAPAVGRGYRMAGEARGAGRFLAVAVRT